MPQGFNDIALDNNPLSTTYRDLSIVNGDLQTATGADAIRQNLQQTLGIFLSEWFLDNTLGVDYLGKILVKNASQRVIDAILINQILAVPGVTALVKYSFIRNAALRFLSITFTAQTTQGIVNYTGTLPTGPVTAGTQT